MPHLIIEHSTNVADLVDPARLVQALHEAALATGLAAVEALRTRAAARNVYAIADQDPANAFIAVTARFGPGRTGDQKQALLNALLGTLEEVLGSNQGSVMLSVEYQEIDPALRINRNNLRRVVAERVALKSNETDPAIQTDDRTE